MGGDPEREGHQSMLERFRGFQRASIVVDKDLRLYERMVRCREGQGGQFGMLQQDSRFSFKALTSVSMV